MNYYMFGLDTAQLHSLPELFSQGEARNLPLGKGHHAVYAKKITMCISFWQKIEC